MFLALIPGILIIIYVYRKDKVEKEPGGLIAKLIIFGALSCIPAMFMEGFMDQYVPSGSQLSYALGMAFLSAALCEELSKFALLFLGSWRNRNFDYRFDGIIYGVSVAVGFALLENILYVSQGGYYVALMRGVLAVPLHAFCGAFMGMFYGAMKRYQIEGKSGKMMGALLGALIVPMMIHGIYDTLAFMGNDICTILLLAFVVFMYIIAIRFINQFSKEDWNAGFYTTGVDPDPMQAYENNARYYNAQEDDFNLYKGENASKKYASGGTDEFLIARCPHCGGALRLPRGAGRVIVTCPHCRQKYETTI